MATYNKAPYQIKIKTEEKYDRGAPTGLWLNFKRERERFGHVAVN